MSQAPKQDGYVASDYYGITAAIKDGAPDYAAAQRKLIGMVESGAATWWPAREMIAVNRGEQGQLPLTNHLIS